MNKNKNFFVLTSHKPNEDQETEIIERFKANIIFLSDELQNLWSNVEPDSEFEISWASPFFNYLKKKSSAKDIVWIQGEPGISHILTLFCYKNDLIPVYSTTKRFFKSEIQENGTSKNIHYFKHVNFRKYPVLK